MSRVTVFQSNIDSFLQRNALSFGGSTVQGVGRRADRLGDRMVAEARNNARTRFNRRTGELADSVVKIRRVSPSGAITVGVGTTVQHGAYLENGTDPHIISAPFAVSRPVYLLRSGGKKDRPPGYQNPRPLRGALSVRHPGSKKGMHWLRDAVQTVIARGV